ncbi:MAG: hypothetical protein K0S23_2710 [Fluviicola sp.]|jgi:hypothetical protein|uniref:hypothetical protein n=1 Tax=Fluviicola sp. TaxID=1917219 RepID=UPI0026048CCB|nr:hypothetical protein [Fluviicola sp.]MDF3028403.1 hypothetical protein [Fluviicola sp.]
MSRKTKWFYGLLVLALIVSCNSPKQQKKINDGKLFEKLKEQKGYLNAKELQRLDNNFSLKVLDKYDFSGYDEEDTLAYFVRSGEYVWIASCYLGEDDDPNPFFCLKEENEQRFKMIRQGVIPALSGDCSYDLEKLVVLAGNYVLVSQKLSGSGYCEDSPLIFTAGGKVIRKSGDPFHFVSRDCGEGIDQVICFKRDFNYRAEKTDLVVRVKEKLVDEETEQETSGRSFDLRFKIRNYTISFQDTLFK